MAWPCASPWSGFDDGSEKDRRLNERKDDAPEHALAHALRVAHINANLTSAADVTNARRLKENAGICFQGHVVGGPFDIRRPDPGAGRCWLSA